MNELLSACPVCGSANLRPRLRVQDKSVSQETFALDECQRCGFLFTNPRPDAASIGPYYESAAYVSHNAEASGLVNQVYRVARRYTVRRKVQLIAQLNGGQPGRLLDYGCGTGHFLAAARQAGWEVAGIEPNAQARLDAAGRVGQPLLEPAALASLPPASFDTITLWHVLEHVHALDDTLAQLLATLRPGGRLLIAVPNPASFDARQYGPYWAAYDVPRHLYHFTPSTMRRLLERHGLRVAQQLPMPLDAYYVSLLSEGLRPAGQRQSKLAALRLGYQSNQHAAEQGGNYSSVLYVAER